MHKKQENTLVCLDLEGVLIPEIWLGLAKKTGIEELKLTTRDIVDYDQLMQHRLQVLDKHHLTIQHLHQVVAEMQPLEGAYEFLEWLRPRTEFIILSDTFREIVMPLMKPLGYPTIFCHRLLIGENDQIEGYQLRQTDQKRKAVFAFQSLNYRIIAAGDSYNDLTMLQSAEQGIFFRPTEKIIQEYPDFPVTHTYATLQAEIQKAGVY